MMARFRLGWNQEEFSDQFLSQILILKRAWKEEEDPQVAPLVAVLRTQKVLQSIYTVLSTIRNLEMIYIRECAQVISKYKIILYKGLEHLWILIPKYRESIPYRYCGKIIQQSFKWGSYDPNLGSYSLDTIKLISFKCSIQGFLVHLYIARSSPKFNFRTFSSSPKEKPSAVIFHSYLQSHRIDLLCLAQYF